MEKSYKNKNVYEALNKIGGPLADQPLKRWLITSNLSWNILWTCALGITMSGLFVSSFGRSPIKDKADTEMSKSEYKLNEDIKKYRKVGLDAMGCFIAGFILWGCAIIGATKRQNLEEKTVQLMLKLRIDYPHIVVNEQDLRKALKYVPYIISKMSAADRVYFDVLMNGAIKMDDNKTFHDMAMAIISGYLEKNPKDLAFLGNIIRQYQKFQPEIQRQ